MAVLAGWRMRLLVALTALLALLGAENLRLLVERHGIHGAFAEPARLYDPAEAALYPPVHRPEEIEAVRREILPRAGILPGDPAETRLEKLFLFLMEEARAARGAPSPRMAALPPLEQFGLAARGEDRLWCANYAMILALFLNAADVPARVVMVTTGRPEDGLDHTFVEAWIPGRGGWVFSDPQADKLWVRAADGRLLGTLAVFDALRAGRTEGLEAAAYGERGIEVRPYAEADRSERIYFTGRSFFEYRLAPRHVGFTPAERLRQWVLDDRRHFSLVEPAVPSWRKTAALLGGLAAAAAWLAALALLLAGRRDRREGRQGDGVPVPLRG